MTEMELALIAAIERDHHNYQFDLEDKIRTQLESMGFKGSSSEFLHHPELIGYHRSHFQLSCAYFIATYVAAHDNPPLMQTIFSNIERVLLTRVAVCSRDKKGCTLLPLEMAQPTFIQNLFATADEPLISLFMKYLPAPKQYVFDALAMPACITAETSTAQQAIKKVLQKNNMDLPNVEEKIIKIQRSFRLKRRMREEMNRIANIYLYCSDMCVMTEEQRLKRTKQMIRQATLPYTPQCDGILASRISHIAQKIDLYQTIRHVTSSSAIESIFNESFYGRRTLLQFYMPFKKASLWGSDVDNGDGNVVCFGTNLIDPLANGDIEIVLDLKKVIQSRPAAFYKVCDLGFDGNIQREAILLGQQLQFTLVKPLRYQAFNTVAFQITNPRNGALESHAILPRHTVIGYDLKNMSQVFVLNFFRFIDNLHTPHVSGADLGESDEQYIAQLYQKLAQLNDEQLELFLTQVATEFTKTAEFNFYGAYKLDFSSIKTIKNSALKNKHALDIKLLIASLNSGHLNLLIEAQAAIPELFKSYRFLDYLLSSNFNPSSKRALEFLRKQCRVPAWMNNDYYDALLVDESDASLFIIEPTPVKPITISTNVKEVHATTVPIDLFSAPTEVDEQKNNPPVLIPVNVPIEEVRIDHKTTIVVVDEPVIYQIKDQDTVAATDLLGLTATKIPIPIATGMSRSAFKDVIASYESTSILGQGCCFFNPIRSIAMRGLNKILSDASIVEITKEQIESALSADSPRRLSLFQGYGKKNASSTDDVILKPSEQFNHKA
ncbi:MAG: hypothetical protein ACHP65_09830 [Legionellales bacterium]